MWDISSLTRDRTHSKSQPPDHQGSLMISTYISPGLRFCQASLMERCKGAEVVATWGLHSDGSSQQMCFVITSLLHSETWNSTSILPFFHSPQPFHWTSLVAQTVNNPPARWETWVRSLGREKPLEKGVVNHSSIRVWRIPWTEEPDDYSPWGHKELDTSEQLSLHF